MYRGHMVFKIPQCSLALWDFSFREVSEIWKGETFFDFFHKDRKREKPRDV